MKPNWNLILPLAALGAVRAAAHALHLFDGSPKAAIATPVVIGAVWLIVVAAKRDGKPFSTLLTTGAVSGIFTIVVQQAAWSYFWSSVPEAADPDYPIDLNGPVARGFAALSTFLVSVAMGAVSGALAWCISLIVGRPAAKPTSLDLRT